jgi:hypothetical protein
MEAFQFLSVYMHSTQANKFVEYWDVAICFFGPENLFCYWKRNRFTVGVSDVCPVMVGKARACSMP